MRVAIFDFDGTLYKKETFQLLMNHLKTHPICRTKYRGFFWSMLPRYLGTKLNLYPEQKMKAYSMELYLTTLKDLSDEELDIYFKEVAKKLKKDFNQTVVDRLEQHKKDQVHVMLVSGAYTNLLHAVADDLNFDQIIGTETLPSKDGITRNAEIHHVNGTIKNDKIEEALQGKDVDWANSYAYGDSYSDKSVLELVGNPVAVQPDSKLRAIAEEREWEII